MKFWEKIESKSSYHYPNSWLVRGRLVPNTCHLKKLGRAHEDQIKARTSELFDSETLEQYNLHYWGVVLRIFADQIASHWKSFPAYMSGTEWPRVFPNHPPQRRHTRPHHQRRHEQSAGGSSGEKWGYGGTAAVMRAWISTVSVAIICSNYFAGQYFDCDTFFEKGEKNMSKNHAYLLKPSTAFY